MPNKNGILVISCIVLVFIALILIFSPILKSKPMPIKAGLTYQDTIMPEDPPDISDKDYRRHTYSINVFSNEKYTFKVSSLSYDVILLYEYRDDKKTQLLYVETLGSGTTEYEVHSAGQKTLFVEALAVECPAEYSLRVEKVK